MIIMGYSEVTFLCPKNALTMLCQNVPGSSGGPCTEYIALMVGFGYIVSRSGCQFPGYS